MEAACYKHSDCLSDSQLQIKYCSTYFLGLADNLIQLTEGKAFTKSLVSNYSEFFFLSPRKKPKFIVNDELPTCILCGKITMKTSVKDFTESSIVFEDGTIEANIDVVIFTTGYEFSFPFFEEPLKSLCTRKVILYKRVFPPNLERSTLAIIGLISLTGSILVGTEFQARWATRVFKGMSALFKHRCQQLVLAVYLKPNRCELK